MALQPGDKLGPYQHIAPIGKGEVRPATRGSTATSPSRSCRNTSPSVKICAPDLNAKPGQPKPPQRPREKTPQPVSSGVKIKLDHYACSYASVLLKKVQKAACRNFRNMPWGNRLRSGAVFAIVSRTEEDGF